ncbi:MAG: PHP domain-containing protein, partial [Pseudomonadota bacterium]
MARPPENPPIKFKRPKRPNIPQDKIEAPAYAELQCTTNFTFLQGASHPGEMVIQAKALGHTAIGVADRNTMAGIVRAHAQAKSEGFKLLVGARIDLVDGLSCLCYPTDRAAYGRLCKLLSDGKRSAPKGECHIELYDLVSRAEGQALIVLPPDDFEARYNDIFTMLNQLKTANPAGIWLALNWLFRGDDRKRMRMVANLAKQSDVPLVATNAALYHEPERRALQDVVSCIREGKKLDDAGFLLQVNAERHLKTPHEMTRLFKDYPQAIAATQDIVALCNFNLDELKYNYPNEPVPKGKTPQQHLKYLV